MSDFGELIPEFDTGKWSSILKSDSDSALAVLISIVSVLLKSLQIYLSFVYLIP